MWVQCPASVTYYTHIRAGQGTSCVGWRGVYGDGGGECAGMNAAPAPIAPGKQ